jgi:polygalacturonase
MRFIAVGVLLLSAVVLSGQDTRNVTEPVIPSACSTLSAQLNVNLSEADETKLDSERIQKAIDACPKGQAVELRGDAGHNAFLSGPLDLREGVTLLIDSGVTLLASRNPRDFDTAPGLCGVVSKAGRGCKPLIGVNGANGAAVMGDGTIDGRGHAKLLGQNVTWWDLAEQARAGGNQNCPRLIVTSHSNNFTLYRITLKNSPNFHVVFGQGDGFTAWGVIIDTPGKGARNTDGIDPSNATNVTITHCFIHTGDDNVAIKAGSGGPSAHFTISHNHFYAGHGMSVGSETNGGLSAMRVSDLTIDGADNGLRIKSNITRGGLVHDVVYEDVCIRDTKNPIFMDPTYTATVGPAKDLIPVFTGIEMRNVRISGGGTITLKGLDKDHHLGILFDGVSIAPAGTKYDNAHADIQLGPGPVNFVPQGEDVSVTGKAGKGEVASCEGKFAAMPKK